MRLFAEASARLRGFRNVLTLFATLICASGSFAMPKTLEGLIEPRNFEVVRAIRQDSVTGMQAALKSGGSLEISQYEGFLDPLQLAVLLQRPQSLKFLSKQLSDIETGLAMATVTADITALDALLSAKPLSQDLISRCLRLFTYRQSPSSVVESRAIVESLIDGRPIQHQAVTRAALPRPAFAAAIDSSELRVAERLIQHSGLDASMSQGLLEDALNAGDVFLVRWLINRQIGNMTRSMWSTLLVEASRAGNIPGVDALVRAGHNVNTADTSGALPLHVAIDRENVQAVRKILALGGSANAPHRDADAALRLPITRATRIGNVEVVDALVRAGATLNQIDRGHRGESWALREAVIRGFPAIVSRLLAGGASPNLVDSDGLTVLHWFPAQFSPAHVQTVNALRRAGMNMNARDTNGQSILASMLHRGPDSHAEVLKLLVSGGARPDESSYRAMLSSPAAARWLLSAGKGDPAFRLDGEPLTQHAVRSGNFEVALEILSAGGPLPDRANYSRILVREVFKMGEGAVMAMLRHQLPQYALQDLLGFAVVSGNVRIAELILDAGGDANTGTMGDQGTMLHELVNALPRRDEPLTEGQHKVLVLLLRRGLDVTASDSSGKTLTDVVDGRPELASSIGKALEISPNADLYSLHDAARLNMESRVRRLLQSGASVNQKNDMGRSALSIALLHGSADAAKVLLRSGANIVVEPTLDQPRSDLSFASDSRYAVVFGSRLLQNQLVTTVRNPDSEIQRLAPRLIDLPDLEWKWNCTGPCRGDGVAKGNTLDQAWSRYAATRNQNGGKTNYIFSVRPAIQYNDRTYNSITSLPSKIGYRVVGKLRIPACPMPLTPAECVPRLIVTVPSDSASEWSVTQGVQPPKSLAAGKKLLMDRTAGDIEIASNSVEGPSFQLALAIEQLPNQIGDIEMGTTIEERVKGYALLAQIREEQLGLRRRLATEKLDPDGITEAMLRLQELGWGVRRISAKMAQKNFRHLAQASLGQSAASLAAVDEQLTRTRKQLEGQLANPSQDLQLLVRSIELAISTARPEAKEVLRKTRDNVSKVAASKKDQEEQLRLTLSDLYRDIDRIVLEYQTWALELAQHCELTEISACVSIPSAQRDKIRDRISSTDIFLSETTLEGRGTHIRRNLGLLTP